MKYTEHYHLPQWVDSDRIMMEDFNQAMETIDAGIAAAQGAVDRPHYMTGGYTGNGKSMEEGGTFIALPFRPRFVVISRAWLGVTYPPDCMLIAGEHMQPLVENMLRFEDSGFRVAHYSGSNLRLNVSDTAYSYIAFR